MVFEAEWFSVGRIFAVAFEAEWFSVNLLEKKWGFSESLCCWCLCLDAQLPCNILWLKRLWHVEKGRSHEQHKFSELIAKLL